MNSELSLYQVKLKEKVDFFWEKRDQYMKEDIIPNCTLGNPLNEETQKWFFSKEYRDHIMNLFSRNQDQLNILFFRKNNEYVGFCVYVTYISEDRKCFIVDYCIDSNYRNQGLGKQFFYLLKDQVIAEGAKYFALNLSNENNRRFWKFLGFEKAYTDEYGEDVYLNRINMNFMEN
ncbi:GNAT family N-acetyltransferase [Clostridium sp. Marseille-QA1073]